jgi:hypothetical protein
MMTKVIEETVAITFDSDCGIEVIPSWCFDYGIQKNFNQSKALDTIFNALSMDGKFTVSNANLRDFLKLVEPYCSEPQTIDSIYPDSIEMTKGFVAYLSMDGYLDRTPYTIFDTYEEADEYLEDLLGDEQ